MRAVTRSCPLVWSRYLYRASKVLTQSQLNIPSQSTDCMLPLIYWEHASFIDKQWYIFYWGCSFSTTFSLMLPSCRFCFNHWFFAVNKPYTAVPIKYVNIICQDVLAHSNAPIFFGFHYQVSLKGWQNYSMYRIAFILLYIGTSHKFNYASGISV